MATKTAVVIQLNHITYAACGGRSMQIATGDDSQRLGDFWGVPQSSGGVFQGYEIVKATSAPSPDSIPVTRVYDKISGNTYHLLGDTATFEGGGAMPLASTIPLPVPTINICKPLTIGGTNYIAHWEVPTKTGGQTYTVAVKYNNTQPVAPLTGAADLAAVVTYLNTNYSAAGTWANDGGRLRLTRTSAAEVGVVFKVV